MGNKTKPGSRQSPIYIISGGLGASGEQLAHTVLAQFPENITPVKLVSKVSGMDKIREVIDEASENDGTIVHTMIDPELRKGLLEYAKFRGVFEFDIIGPLLERLGQVLSREPLNKPGLYRHQHRAYFERMEAIEFTRAQDDGQNPERWKEAEILLAGVSRTGKTPLSMYLSFLGWKVANIPIVLGLNPNQELFNQEPGRVVGLTIEPGQLLHHRQHRQKRLGTSGPSNYTDPQNVYEEEEYARLLFRKHGFYIVDVTDKPIETIADEVLEWVSRGGKGRD
jgi:[pyruvate, water dikinase]-phosphate phosphotransferase / [pyruvate, water dikinase] kinase